MRRYLTIFEVAKMLSVSTMTIRRWWTNGKMPEPVRPGGTSIRWDEAVLEKWLADNCSVAPEQTET